MFVCSIAISLYYDWRIALFMMGLAPIVCIVMGIMAQVPPYSLS